MVTVTLTGAHIVVYINNKRYTAVQSVNFAVEYGEEATLVSIVPMHKLLLPK